MVAQYFFSVFYFVQTLLFLTGYVDCQENFKYQESNMKDSYLNGTSSNCSLILPDPSTQALIIQLLEQAKVLKYKVTIDGFEDNLLATDTEGLYNPHHWMLTSGQNGKAMLMLHDWASPLSLFTLSYSYNKVEIHLTQQPQHCLQNKSRDLAEVEHIMRETFLGHIGNANQRDLALCNRHLQRDGELTFVCCTKMDGQEMICSQLKENVWLAALLGTIRVLQVLLVLFSPALIPVSFFRLHTVFEDYVFKPGENERMSLNVVKFENDFIAGDSFRLTVQHDFTHLSTLRKVCRAIPAGKVHSLNIEAIQMAVRPTKIIPAGYAPVGLVNFLRNFFARCHMRHEIQSVGTCCNENMCKQLPCNVTLPWYKCLRVLSTLLLVAIFLSPYILRVLFYFAYESEFFDQMREALARRNIRMFWTGNLTTHLSPFHTFFVVMYIFILAEMFLYKIFLSDHMKRKLKYIVRKCFLDMREVEASEVLGSIVSMYISPCRKLGIVGCVLLPAWILLLPFMILLALILITPMINVFLRFVINFGMKFLQSCSPNIFNSCRNYVKLQQILATFIVQQRKERKRKNNILQSVSLLLTLITIIIAFIFIFECVSFYTEMIIYAIIGIILNSQHTMKFISIVFLIGIYALECFGSVYDSYVSFNKFINSEVLQLLGDKTKAVAKMNIDEQENTAFVYNAPKEAGPVPENVTDSLEASIESPERIELVAGTEGFLKWNACRLILFLDKSDIPYVPKDLVFKAAKLSYLSCPGPVYKLYLRAFLDFFRILLFLAFVLMIISAFGSASNISTANQTLATLAGGFLPFALRKFLLKPQSSPTVDKNSLLWQGLFSEFIENYCKRWNMRDIIVTNPAAYEDGDTVDTTEVTSEETVNLLSHTAHPEIVDLVIVFKGGEKVDYYVPVHSRYEETIDDPV